MTQFNLAWVDPSETTFTQDYARVDERFLSLNYKHDEGKFAVMDIEIKNPHEGILSMARKQWAWASLGTAPNAVPLGLFRVVAVPSNLIGEKLTLSFTAEPDDYLEQKKVVADGLRQLPGYDPVWLDEKARMDDDVVLEGYTVLYHIDPITHVVTVSDLLEGEDGLVEVTRAQFVYDSLQEVLNGKPAFGVDFLAEVNWTQKGTGGVQIALPEFNSYTLGPGDFPGVGSTVGEGWTVSAILGLAKEPEVRNKSFSGGVKVKGGLDDPIEEMETRFSRSDDIYLGSGYRVGSVVTRAEGHAKYDPDRSQSATPEADKALKQLSLQPPPEDAKVIKKNQERIDQGESADDETPKLVSYGFSKNWSDGVIPLYEHKPIMQLGYGAGRGQKEIVLFTLYADVQAVLTRPENSGFIVIDDMRTVDLSDPLDDPVLGYDVPIGDTRRRSYITTARGLLSLEHLILRARHTLIAAARCVDITAQVTFEKWLEITLRKNVHIVDDRLLGTGEATGKVVSRSLTLKDRTLTCSFIMSCAVGNGGAVEATEGQPSYGSVDYMGPDYQEFTGRTVLIDTSVGYVPPPFRSNDDGLDLFRTISAEEAFAVAPVVVLPAAEQLPIIESGSGGWLEDVFQLPEPPDYTIDWFQLGGPPQGESVGDKMVQARQEYFNEFLKIPELQTKLTFRLKSMLGNFETPTEVEVTDLKIPTMVDLGAAGEISS